MTAYVSRREMIGTLTLAGSAVVLPLPAVAAAQVPTPDETAGLATFPSQDPKLVREIVGASHRDIDRVGALLKIAPRLANAAYDWGFGDWETPLGAASHTGRREIALLLLDHGARPDIFTYAMLGKVDAVKAMIEARPGLQRTRGPHGITLLAHADTGDDENTALVEYLKSLGDADNAYQNLPLPEGSREQLVGNYTYGPTPNHRLSIEAQPKDQRLVIKGPPGNVCRLFHQGDLVFHPAGAPEVRLSFTPGADGATALTITTPNPLLVARRTM